MRRHFPLCTFLGVLALGACAQDATPVADAASIARVAAPTVAPAADAAALDPAQQAAWTALLHRLDRDGDGVVARSEHAIAAAVTFSRMDRDSDDTVTVEEMDSEREALLDTAPTDTARRLAQVDANRDGHLDSREHDAATRVVFNRYDRNADTRLERAEFLAVLQQLQAAGGAAGGAAD